MNTRDYLADFIKYIQECSREDFLSLIEGVLPVKDDSNSFCCELIELKAQLSYSGEDNFCFHTQEVWVFNKPMDKLRVA